MKNTNTDDPQDLVIRRREELLARTAPHALWGFFALAIAIIVFRPELASVVWTSVTTLLEIGIGVLIGRHLDSVF